ncbi:MAG: hypothetical protein H6925_04710 [Holosporaceae bacterium]|nr:MAG: hypothetical protein H6925_04710 [Holosporaceae bacterium]
MKTLLALAQDAGFPDRVLRDSEEVMLAEAVVGHHQGLPLQNTGLLFDAGHTAVLPPELVDRILEMAGLDAAARFSLTHCAAYERYGFLTGLMGRKRPPVLMGYHLAVARRMFLHGGPATYLNMRGLWPNPADTRAYLRRVQGWNAASGARVVRLDLSLCNQNERALTRPIVVTRAPLLAQPSVLSLMTGVRDFILDDVVFDPRTDPDLGHRFSVDRLMRALAWRNIRCLSLRRTGITDADLDFIVGCLLGQHHLSLDLKSNRLTHLSNEAIAFFASHVTTLGLSNNAISNIGDLIGALHQGTALHTLYLRSTGMRGLRLYYMLLEALQGRSSLTAVDLRDNPGLGLILAL